MKPIVSGVLVASLFALAGCFDEFTPPGGAIPAAAPAAAPAPAAAVEIADGAIITAESQYAMQEVMRRDLPLGDDGVSGPFAVLSDTNYLFITRCGQMVAATRDGDNVRLGDRKPLPTPGGFSVACDTEGKLGGVKGLIANPASKLAYVAYNTRTGPECIKLAVVRYSIEGSMLSGPTLIRETNPCYPEKISILPQSGGGMALAPDGTLYVGIGDFGGMTNAQDDAYDYGKIYRVAPGASKAEVYAKGVRNPQGLALTGGLLVETEHGPKGGDEINIVAAGDNLGWPTDSYGSAYNRDLYANETNDVGFAWGRASMSKAPAMAFVPSIAPVMIATYPAGSQFGLWANDLILATLSGKIYRIRMEGGHAVYAEPLVTTGTRNRFVQITPSGAILIKADPNTLIEVRRAKRPKVDAPPVPYTAAQVAEGKRGYSDYCASCHGGRLEGTTAGALSGPTVNHTIGSFYAKVQAMPVSAPHSLPPEKYAAIMAYILSIDCHPPISPEQAFPETLPAPLAATPVSKGTCS